MLGWILVALLIGFTVFFIVRSVSNLVKGKGGCAGCSNGGCPHCGSSGKSCCAQKGK